MADNRGKNNRRGSGSAYNNGRVAASDKIAEQRRRKTALEELQAPRLSGGSGSSNRPPRLSKRENAAAERRTATSSRRSKNTKTGTRNIQVVSKNSSAGSYVSRQTASGRQLFGKKKSSITAGRVISGCIIVFFVLIVIFMLTNKNGVEVFVDGNSVGIVMDKGFSEEYIKTTCSAKLVANLGTNVQITSEIKTKKVHTSKNSEKVFTTDYMTKTVTEAISYNVEATVISVNGSEMAVVANNEAAQSVQDQILSAHKLSYIEDTSTIIEGPVIEGIELSTKYVDGSEIMSNEQAYEILNGTKSRQLTYTIEAGDSFGKVASMYGVTTADIQAANPDLDPGGLSVGDEVKVNATVPVLDIKVVTQTIDKSSGTTVVLKTTYINGVEQDTAELNSSSANDDAEEGESGGTQQPSSGYSDDEDIADKVAQDGGSY